MNKFRIECIENTKVDNLLYARYIAEPLNKGDSQTLGNSLRRTLLSELEGTAITAIKIEGVPHEFSVINNLREDTIELINNIKGIVLKSHSQEPKIVRLSVHEPGEILARDILTDADVEVINPNWYIATLEEGGQLEMEMRVEVGKGFVPAEKMTEQLPLGWIKLDAVFMPVKKVAYYVENTRVGQSTDYERLILDVWTNGSIDPKKAISLSAQYLRDKLLSFVNLDNEIVLEKEPEETTQQTTSRIEDIPIEELDFSVRAFNCLKRANISCLGDLLKKTERELMEIKNFGRKSAEEVILRLKELGYQLKPGRKDEE